MHERVDLEPEYLELPQLARIDLDDQLARTAGEGRDGAARGLGVEPGAEAHDEVGVLDGQIRVAAAVGAEGADQQRVVGRQQIGGRPGGRHGQPEPLHPVAYRLLHAGQPDPPAGDHHRALRDLQPLAKPRQLVLDARILPGARGRGREAFKCVRIHLHALHVVRHVHHHRAGPAVGGQIRGLLQLVADAGGIADLRRVVGDRAAEIEDRRLLEADLSHAGVTHHAEGRDLPGHVEDGHRVVEAAADPGDQVRRTGSAGSDGGAEPTGDARVAVRRHRTGLLVLRTHERRALDGVQRVDQVERGPTRHREDVTNAEPGELRRNVVRALHLPDQGIASRPLMKSEPCL